MPCNSHDYFPLAARLVCGNLAINLRRGSWFLSPQAQWHRDGASSGRESLGRNACSDNDFLLREAGDARATCHADVQTAARLFLGLRAHQDEYVQLRDVRRVLAAIRFGGMREFLPTDQRPRALQSGLVRSVQVLLQQFALLRGGPPLSQRLHQALSLLLLQDHGELLKETSRRWGWQKCERRASPGAHYSLVRESVVLSTGCGQAERTWRLRALNTTQCTCEMYKTRR